MILDLLFTVFAAFLTPATDARIYPHILAFLTVGIPGFHETLHYLPVLMHHYPATIICDDEVISVRLLVPTCRR